MNSAKKVGWLSSKIKSKKSFKSNFVAIAQSLESLIVEEELDDEVLVELQDAFENGEDRKKLTKLLTEVLDGAESEYEAGAEGEVEEVEE